MLRAVRVLRGRVAGLSLDGTRICLPGCGNWDGTCRLCWLKAGIILLAIVKLRIIYLIYITASHQPTLLGL